LPSPSIGLADHDISPYLKNQIVLELKFGIELLEELYVLLRRFGC
jgi:hypothetical protein